MSDTRTRDLADEERPGLSSPTADHLVTTLLHFSKLHIAVVDDNPADRVLFQRILDTGPDHDWDITFLANGRELKSCLAEESIDLVFVDHYLGAERGVELISECSFQYPGIAFVLLTGMGGEDVAVTAMRAGANDYLSKDTLSAESIHLCVNQVIRRQFKDAQFDALINAMDSAVLICDDQGRVRDANQSAKNLFESRFDELHTQTLLSLLNVSVSESGAVYESTDELLEQLRCIADRSFGDVLEIALDVGAEQHMLELSVNQATVFGERRYLCLLRDITERRLLEKDRDRQAAIIDATPDFVGFYSRDGQLEIINPAGRRLAGIDATEALPELEGGRYFCSPIDAAILRHLANAQHWTGELNLMTHDTGRLVPVSVVATAVLDASLNISGYAMVMRDVTSEREARDQLQQMAENDALTGLANRKLFIERLELSIARARRSEAKLAVLFIDLDHFKGINDTLGHDAGDELLIRVANKLREITRNTDLVARLGGDEFTILMDELEDSTDCVNLANKIIDALGEPHILQGTTVFTTPSVGIATWPDCASDAAGLLQAADVAMYQAKFDGRNRFRIYSQTLHQRVVWEENLKNSLLAALENEEFSMVYQPVVDAEGNICSVEALMRWDMNGQTVMPDEFIPVAEKSGLISKIGIWGMVTAVEQLHQWTLENGYSGQLAVNVSLQQLRDNSLLECLQDVLRRLDIDPCRIELELTETHLVNELEDYRENIERLRQMGVRLAIDDFGTGYASFRHLRLLPFETIKIDRMFLVDTPQDTDHVSAVEAMIALARALKMRVVIEGVEYQEQHDWLRQWPDLLFQGHLFYRASAVSSVTEWLSDKRIPA